MDLHALCRQTRQVVAFVIGDRSAATCQRLWEKIPEAFRQAHCFSDFWEAYQLVIPPDTVSTWLREKNS